MSPDQWSLSREGQPYYSAGRTWHSGLPQTDQQSSVAAGLLVVAVEGDPCQGGGSGGWGAAIRSVPEARYDEERAEAVGVGTDLSVVAVTGVWGRAEGSVLDWL